MQQLEFGFLEEMILGSMEASEVCKHSLQSVVSGENEGRDSTVSKASF